jgi:hypothetical protein
MMPPPLPAAYDLRRAKVFAAAKNMHAIRTPSAM